MHPDTARLFALDAALHAEADAMLLASGLGAIIAESGYVPVGSYVMRTMTWHDLDFELHVEEPDWERHLEIGMRLARTGWPRRLVCEDGFRRDELTSSYYWGLRVSDPALGCLSDADERIWKLDLHMSTPEQFAHAHRPPRALGEADDRRGAGRNPRPQRSLLPHTRIPPRRPVNPPLRGSPGGRGAGNGRVPAVARGTNGSGVVGAALAPPGVGTG